MPREIRRAVEKRPSDGTRDREVAALADRQEGIVAWWQLRERGFRDRLIRRRVAAARLFEVFPWAYSLSPRPSVRGRFMAAALSCGPQAVLSHHSAAAAWDLRPWPSGLIDVTVPGNRGERPGLRIHRANLGDQERTAHDNFPVTSVTRTLIDLASLTDIRTLERLVDKADRHGRFDLDELLTALPGRRGARKLRAILTDYATPEPARSEFEDVFRGFCREHGLPLPSLNVPLLGYEADALWEPERVIVELDSWEFHKTRRQFELDREKAAALERADYRVLRFTWRQMHREPADMAETIRRALREARKTRLL